MTAAVTAMGDMGGGPFQIGDFRFAGRFEDAVAGVPVRLQRDVVEGAMRQSADQGRKSRREAGVLDGETTPAIKPGADKGRGDIRGSDRSAISPAGAAKGAAGPVPRRFSIAARSRQ